MFKQKGNWCLECQSFHHVVRKRAASSHCLPWNHTSILYLKSDFYLDEYKQSFQILLLLLPYGILVCTFISTNKFCHHQNVNFLFTPEFSHFIPNNCLHLPPQVLWIASADVFITIYHLYVQTVRLDNILSATQVLLQFHRQQRHSTILY